MEKELFVESPVSNAYFKFTLPLVFSLIAGLIYNMTDTYFIGHTGNPSAVAAISLCAPIFMVMNSLGSVLGIGGSSLISRLLGEKRAEDVGKISSFCFYGTFISGCIISLIMLTCEPIILQVLGVNDQTMIFAAPYYKFLALGAPFIIFSGVPVNIIRAEGLAKEVMAAGICGTVINIILDPLLIFAMNQGVSGAAIATVFSNIITDIIYVVIILKKSSILSLSIRKCNICLQELKDILSIGIPGSLQSFMQCIAAVAVNLSLCSYGNDKIAAMGIALKAVMVIVMIIVGFSFGAQPLIGYNYGACNGKRVKEILKFSFIFQGMMTFVLAAVMFIGAPYIIGIFIENNEIILLGSLMLRISVLSLPLVSAIFICTALFQSAGKASQALFLSLCHQGIIFIPVILVLKMISGYYGVISAQTVTDLLTFILTVFLMKRTFSVFFKCENNNSEISSSI